MPALLAGSIYELKDYYLEKKVFREAQILYLQTADFFAMPDWRIFWILTGWEGKFAVLYCVSLYAL